MDFKKVKRRKSEKFTQNVDLYKYGVQFYKEPPMDTISLADFEQFALDRLAVLRVVENASFKHTKFSEAYGNYFGTELRKHKELLSIFSKKGPECDSDDLEKRRRDHISHYILRLAYCRSDELRRWFLKQETDLFVYRLVDQGKELQAILHHNGLFYEKVNSVDNKELKDLVYSLTAKQLNYEMDIFKIPFTEVLDLVGMRKVYLENGFAYVLYNDLASVVGNFFRTQLSQALAVTARLLPQLEEDERLLSILKGINDRYLGKDFGKTSKVGSGEVVPEMVDQLSKTSFPLCMRMMHEGMRERHHLKHHGRLVYGLFLKAIGLSLEDAHRFFREEFTKAMDLETYEKKGYSYNIRYNYGTEGKKANFTPYSCLAIITKHAPGPGEVHGCPYRHFDKNILAQRLQSMHISATGIHEIVELSTKGHYQLACTRQFELSHGGVALSQAITHPNYFYEESRKVKSEGTFTEVKVKPVTQRSVMMQSQMSQDPASTQSTQASAETLKDCEMDDDDHFLSQLANTSEF